MISTAEQTSSAEPTGRDRRRDERFPRRSTAQLFMLPSGRLSHPINVTVVDYSATGIGLISRENLMVGQRYVVREPFLTQNASSMYTVVRSDAKGNGIFSIGLLQDNKLADEFDLPEQPALEEVPRRIKTLLIVLCIAVTAKTVQLIVV